MTDDNDTPDDGPAPDRPAPDRPAPDRPAAGDTAPTAPSTAPPRVPASMPPGGFPPPGSGQSPVNPPPYMPTTAGPGAVAPGPQQWGPPPTSPPTFPPTVPTPVVPANPVSPARPVIPTGAATPWGAPPLAPGTAPPGGYAPTPVEQTPGKGRGAAWLLAAILAILAAVGGYFLVNTLTGGTGAKGGIDECRIDADGALSAAGWVSSDDALDAKMEVRFNDAATGKVVDRDAVPVKADAGQRVRWNATGSAGDQVERITCVLGAPG